MAVSAPHLLRLERCPRCRHDLSELPLRRRCPECGFVYDDSMFLLEGWRLPDRRTWRRFLVVYGPLAVLAAAVLVIDHGWSWHAMLSLLIAAALPIGILYFFASHLGGSGRTALAQYLVSADGVSRPGKPTYLWRNYTHVMLLPDGKGAWRLHMYPRWWWPLGPPVVNARLECDESEAEAVRNEIQTRINAARRAEAEARQRALPRRWR
jgi:hypothetical protein